MRLLLPLALAGITLGMVTSTLAGEAVQLTVDAGKRFQTIEGFGTCLVSWNPEMDRFYRTPAAQKLYAEELRFNILRCNLWGDGTIGPTQDWQAISFKDPAFAARDKRTPVFLAFAQAIRKINPEVKVIGTVWSPPAWMKENQSITDKGSGAIDGKTYLIKGQPTTNRVKPEYYPHFAKWLVEMCKYYAAQGVPLYAVSPANEPQFTQKFESCVWTAKDLATITAAVGELLEREKLNVQLFGPETMTGFNWPGGPNHLYIGEYKANPAALRRLGFFATHGYADGVVGDTSENSSAQFRQIIAPLNKPYWVTEGGTGRHAWPAPVSKGGVALAIHNALVAGHAAAFVPWQFAEKGDTEHALTTLEGLDKKGHAVRHFSRFIPAGAVRIDTQPAYGEVCASAYLHPARAALTIVLINPTKQAQTVNLKIVGAGPLAALQTIRTSETEDSQTLEPLTLRDGRGSLTLPGPSIVTLTTVR